MRGRSVGQVVFFLRGAILLAILMLRPLTASAAPILLGDSVEASLYTSGTVVTQFAPSAVVGAGTEFTGTVRDPGKAGLLWNVTLDISATGFTIGWTSQVPESFISSGAVLLGLSLTGLDFTPAAILSGLAGTGYSCTPSTNPACGAGPAPPVLSFTDNSVNLAFHTLRGAESYTFAFATTETTPSPVPEPSSLALLGAGFATFIAGRFRRREARL